MLLKWPQMLNGSLFDNKGNPINLAAVGFPAPLTLAEVDEDAGRVVFNLADGDGQPFQVTGFWPAPLCFIPAGSGGVV